MDRHTMEIDLLLRQIAQLERRIEASTEDHERIPLERSLKHRVKRFEHLIPFKFRLKLRRMCKEAGISSEFV
ncbi:MAG: hypothetical protein AAFQ83_21485 [Bacteroidota bacterium]